MTKLGMESVKCAKCGKTSTQTIIYSINTSLGTKESRKELLKRKQECPFCGYKTKAVYI